MGKEKLSIYGINIYIEGPVELLDRLKKDFSYFCGSNAEYSIEINIKANLQEAPDDIFPKNKLSMKKSDLKLYDAKEKRFIDYNGKALSVYDYKTDTCGIYCPDIDLLHELTYLLIHSRFGEILDKKHIHRVHAMGVSYKGKGVLCLLPRGGGKTTLCLELLKNTSVKLLSDDTPLLTKSSMIIPVPIRIGINNEFKLDIPREYLGYIVRRKFGPKKLINVEYFKDQISGSVPTSMLVIGKRINSNNSSINKVSKFYAVFPMVTNCILGIGVPQMIEYFIRFNIKDIASKALILISRIIVSFNVILKSRVYVFNIGTDISKNALVFLEHIEKEGS